MGQEDHSPRGRGWDPLKDSVVRGEVPRGSEQRWSPAAVAKNPTVQLAYHPVSLRPPRTGTFWCLHQAAWSPAGSLGPFRRRLSSCSEPALPGQK